MADRELYGKVVVITGASSGFGRGAALLFAEKGAYVVLGARRSEMLQQVASDCQACGGLARTIPTNVTEPADVAYLADRAVNEFGHIDVWVNIAGAGAVGRFEDVPLEDHIRVIQTDLLGTLYGSYFAMRQFREQGAGTLINMATLVGEVPAPYFASYVAAKHGVEGLGASLRQELKEDHVDTIHVCTVKPTTFDTPFFEHAAQYTGHEASPIPPTYDPTEVVETVVSLAMDPKEEVAVGAAARIMNTVHHVFPGVVEALMARQTRKAELGDAGPGERTSGSLHEPSGGGWKK
jgi:short-subunit dehydrogenase